MNRINVITGLLNYSCPRWALSCVRRRGQTSERGVFFCAKIDDCFAIFNHTMALSSLCKHYSFSLWFFFQVFVSILFALWHMKNLIYSWCTVIFIFDAFLMPHLHNMIAFKLTLHTLLEEEESASCRRHVIGSISIQTWAVGHVNAINVFMPGPWQRCQQRQRQQLAYHSFLVINFGFEC